MGLAQKHAQLHRPGDTAQVSGVFRVYHQGHRKNHDVVVLAGETFPACRTCRSLVAFELMDPVEHVAMDWDFTGPNLQLIHSRDKNKK